MSRTGKVINDETGKTEGEYYTWSDGQTTLHTVGDEVPITMTFGSIDAARAQVEPHGVTLVPDEDSN